MKQGCVLLGSVGVTCCQADKPVPGGPTVNVRSKLSITDFIKEQPVIL
jgi:hypothetical protein